MDALSQSQISPDPIDVFVGERLRAFRKARRLSLAQLGRMIGVSYQQMQKYERGTNRVSASQMWRLSKALHVDIIRLFPGEAGGGEDGDAVGWAMAIGRLDPETRRVIIDLVDAIRRASAENTGATTSTT